MKDVDECNNYEEYIMKCKTFILQFHSSNLFKVLHFIVHSLYF